MFVILKLYGIPTKLILYFLIFINQYKNTKKTDK